MFTSLLLQASGAAGSATGGMADFVTDLSNTIGIDLFDEDIDNVVFQTNEFLCNSDFIGSQGPFWWILQMSMALGALFSIIVAGGLAYKMMVKNEPIDVFKIMKVLGIALVMCFWYPPSMSGIGGNSNASILMRWLTYQTVLAAIHMTCMRQKPSRLVQSTMSWHLC